MDAMTSLMVLICLGLCVGTGNPLWTGTLPRPTLWAEPDSLVPFGSSVILWCQGASGIQEFILDKAGSSSPRDIQFQLEPGDKAKFSIPYITKAHAGTYYCHCKSPTNWSERSNPLKLVVTGLYRKPTLFALSSPVLTSGDTVELKCASFQGFNRFILIQEGDSETPRISDSKQFAFGETQTVFTVGPVTPGHRWSFRCYGHFAQTPQQWSHPSDLLQLLVTGSSRRPSVLSLQGWIVTLGQNVTLQCRSNISYDTFALNKEGRQDISQRPGHHHQSGFSQAEFSLGPVSSSHYGQYRCFGGQGPTPLWSEPSEPLDILVAGQIMSTPNISVQPGPSVNPGENVTLLCASGGKKDTFLLAKEGATGPPLRFKVDKRENITEAKFSLGPVTTAHGGTYRCYSSNSRVPYRLSYPSAPLQLQVSGPSEDSRNPTSVPTADVCKPNTLILWLSIAGALLGLLFFLFLLHYRRSQAGHWKAGASYSKHQDTGHRPAYSIPQSPTHNVRKGHCEPLGEPALPQLCPGSAMSPQHSASSQSTPLSSALLPSEVQSRQDEHPHGATNAQVKRTGLRRGVASSSPVSGAQQKAQDGQTKENAQSELQEPAPDAPHEVTYAQLEHLDTAQETTAPFSSLSGKPRAEPTVYATLAFH